MIIITMMKTSFADAPLRRELLSIFPPPGGNNNNTAKVGYWSESKNCRMLNKKIWMMFWKGRITEMANNFQIKIYSWFIIFPDTDQSREMEWMNIYKYFYASTGLSTPKCAPARQPVSGINKILITATLLRWWWRQRRGGISSPESIDYTEFDANFIRAAKL